MMSQELKEKALKLRQSGKSYDEITKETGIPSGMLSYWFSKYEWSKDVTRKNKEKNLNTSIARITLMNKKRMENLSERYKIAILEAEKEFQLLKNNSLFIGALMLYLGEGDKSINNPRIRIGNVDPYVLKIFIKFLSVYCKISKGRIKFWLLAYPNLNSDKCLTWWIKELGLENNQVYRTQIIQGKNKTKRLLYGVGNIILSNKVLKTKILKWIELACMKLNNAVIV